MPLPIQRMGTRDIINLTDQVEIEQKYTIKQIDKEKKKIKYLQKDLVRVMNNIEAAIHDPYAKLEQKADTPLSSDSENLDQVNTFADLVNIQKIPNYLLKNQRLIKKWAEIKADKFKASSLSPAQKGSLLQILCRQVAKAQNPPQEKAEQQPAKSDKRRYYNPKPKPLMHSAATRPATEQKNFRIHTQSCANLKPPEQKKNF